jgi:Protein of unknown function (DUF2806)
MEDLTGFGRATEKFLELVQSSIGTLYRPRAIRKEGEANARVEAYKVITLAKANNEARQLALDGEQALAERAISRLRHQELNKQKNLESIIDRTIPKIEGGSIEDAVDKDWLSYFFESCSTISEDKVQTIWSDVLASKITGEPLPRKIIDCLRWMDSQAANQFAEFAKPLFLFHGSFSMIVRGALEKELSIDFGYDTDALLDIGLIKENLNKTIRFTFASLDITCREPSDRSLDFRKFFEFTQTGKRLALVVVPSIKQCYRELNGLNYGGEDYFEKQLELENKILPPGDRIGILCGGILGFLIETDAEVLISNAIERVEGEQHFHDSREVMSVSTLDGRLTIEQYKKRRHWKALSDFEKLFLERLTETLNAHAGLIGYRPKNG